MTKIFTGVITFYQILFPIRGNCRFYPTCSEYAKIVIQDHGIAKGGWLALLRILNCQPFNKISNFKFQMPNFK